MGLRSPAPTDFANFDSPERPRHEASRGGYRICYVHYESFHVVAFVTIYDKTETSDVTPSDKKMLNSLIRLLYDDLERGI